MQMTGMKKVIHSRVQFACVFHSDLHRNEGSRKVVKGNQIIVLTELQDGRIFQERKSPEGKDSKNRSFGKRKAVQNQQHKEVMPELVAYIDGGCLGNPGPSGIGVVIRGCAEGPVRIAKWIGHQDNNVAEYAALMEALQYAVSLRARKLHVYSDSEVVVRQMTGEYICRSPRLYSLHWTCRKLARSLAFSISHVRRAENAEANGLAQAALRRK
jgi:ribonuclease HI